MTRILSCLLYGKFYKSEVKISLEPIFFDTYGLIFFSFSTENLYYREFFYSKKYVIPFRAMKLILIGKIYLHYIMYII